MSNIVKIADGVYIKNFSVKQKWIRADLEIDISRFRYFGRWLDEGGMQWKCGNEDDTKMVFHIQKEKQKWDEEFWTTLKEAGMNEVPDLDKLIKKMSKHPAEFVEKKEEKKVVNRILNRAW